MEKLEFCVLDATSLGMACLTYFLKMTKRFFEGIGGFVKALFCPKSPWKGLSKTGMSSDVFWGFLKESETLSKLCSVQKALGKGLPRPACLLMSSDVFWGFLKESEALSKLCSVQKALGKGLPRPACLLMSSDVFWGFLKESEALSKLCSVQKALGKGLPRPACLLMSSENFNALFLKRFRFKMLRHEKSEKSLFIA